MSNTSVLFTTGEVAKRFRVSSGTIRNLVASKNLTPVRIGDRLLFHEDELVRFEREGVKSVPKIDRSELDAFITSLNPAVEGTLEHRVGIIMRAFRGVSDGLPYFADVPDAESHNRDMSRMVLNLTEITASHFLVIVETKRQTGESKTEFERLAIHFLSNALVTLRKAA